jgi:hypothetical protein
VVFVFVLEPGGMPGVDQLRELNHGGSVAEAETTVSNLKAASWVGKGFFMVAGIPGSSDVVVVEVGVEAVNLPRVDTGIQLKDQNMFALTVLVEGIGHQQLRVLLTSEIVEVEIG